VLQFDAARWAGTLGYFHQSTREALEIIRRLRKMTYQLIVTLPEPVWSHTVDHPRDGEINLDRWIEIQERHVPHHIEQMRQNFENWISTHPPRKSAAPSAKSSMPSRMVSLTAGF
jgi:hypothetical protein